MKRFAIPLLLAGCVLPPISSRAIDLKQSRFTQVVNDVQIISAADKSSRAAAMNDLFKVPDILRTGPNSRAELVAEDQTITRVGANTIFSFDPANRTIDLQKGSLLFHSPKGRGGGTVRTGSATASVLGTTIVVTTAADGGFKLLVLEGEAEIKFLNGLAQHLSAGQMTFILPGGGMSPIIVFRLDANTKDSLFIKGFPPLPSQSKIDGEINKQVNLIKQGKAQDTGLLVGGKANSSQVEAVDANAVQDYFNRRSAYQPVLAGTGYRTVDGLVVTPNPPNEPVADALFPARALSTDVDVNSSVLNPNHTFLTTGPFNVTAPGFDAFNHFLPDPFSGFFGRNINLKTANINLAPYAAVPRFDFLAAKNINIAGSLSFGGFVQALRLTAGGQIVIAPGSTISAQTYNFYLGSFGPMRFNSVNVQNAAGGIQLSSASDLTLNNGSVNASFDAQLFGHAGVNLNGMQISANDEMVSIISDSSGVGATPAISINNSTLSGPGGVVVLGGGDVNVNNSTLNSYGSFASVSLSSLAGSLSLNGGSINLGSGGTPTRSALALHSVQLSAGKDLNIAGTSITADSLNAQAGGSVNINGGASLAVKTITLNAGDGILMDNVTMTGNSASPSSLNMTAKNTVTINNLDLSALASINIIAHTINLFNDAFAAGSNPNMTCFSGLYTLNQKPLAGYVNFISGNTYGGVPVTSAMINPASGSGFHIFGGAP